MTGDGSTPVLVVDVRDLPERVPVPLTRRQRAFPWAYLVLGAAYLGLQLLWGSGSSVLLVVGASWVLLGAFGLVSNRRTHLRLEPEGVRRVGVLGRGRLTPWVQVAEVRPPEAWHEVAHLRSHGRFPETTDLPGLTTDDARELQRRLTAARTAAQPSRPRDGGPTPP